jgi:peptide methionine sulfoxide reductase MsrB
MARMLTWVLALVAALIANVDAGVLLRHGPGHIETESGAVQAAPKKSQFLEKLHGKASQVQSSKQPVMPIESHLMGMSPEMIQHMFDEMTATGSAVSQANNFVRSHPNDGWFWCANDGQTCWCNGKVRFGSHAGGWPSFTNPIPVAGSMVCNGPNFASTFAPRAGFHCQCADDSEKTWQNVRLRYNSVSYLQEAWISMTRVLAQAKLLPLSGDRAFGGEELFNMRGSGDQFRLFMDLFINEQGATLPLHPSNCLEWAPEFYMPRFPACVAGNKFHLDFEGDVSKMHMDAAGHVHCDNVHLPHCLNGVQIDIALNTNVWEHEQDPFEAMASLYSVMKPGGVMLFTVPFTAPYHGVPYDFYRYTKSGVLHLLQRAGFCVPKSKMASGGDFISDISLFSGLGPGDFSSAEILQSYRRGYDNIPDGPIVVMALAYKLLNPTDPCPA